ncbi:hypothetical protein AMECASPLE_037674 [Ameca splendens]|uniref:Uncharacterized protein n=1 Tax=Ameca splendens TaxID=208324 RepID=A0ABV0YJ50_9TELE
MHSGGVCSTVALQQQGSGFDAQPGVFLHGVCMFSLFMRGFSQGTPTSSHNPKMIVRLIGLSTLPLGVNEWVRDCLSCMSLCCPAIDWRRVQGVPCLSPVDCWR